MDDWLGSMGEWVGRGAWGDWGKGFVTLQELRAHENREEDSVWENRGGAKAQRETLRGWEAQSLRERA